MSNEKVIKQLIFGGPIITINDNQPMVEAVGVEGEIIVAVGPLEKVRNQMGNDCLELNLNGNSLLPGFIDSHLHPIAFLFFLFNLDLASVKSVNELQETLKTQLDVSANQ